MLLEKEPFAENSVGKCHYLKGGQKQERAGEGDGEKLERSGGATDFSAHLQPQTLTWPVAAVLSWFANLNHLHIEESQGRILQIH